MVLIGFYLSNRLAYGDCLSYVLFIIRFVLSGKGRGCEVPAFFDKIKKVRNFVPYSTPVTIVTAPEGHWGPDSPDPLRRSAPGGLAKRPELCSLFNPPVTIVTAPEGHWGPDSPDPLRRSAPGGLAKKAGTLFLIQPPVTIVTAPGVALGTGFPRPLASLRSGRFGKKGRNFVPYSTPQSLS